MHRERANPPEQAARPLVKGIVIVGGRERRAKLARRLLRRLPVRRAANDNRRLLSFAEAERSWRIFGVLMMALMAALFVLTVRAAFADAVVTGTARVIDGDTIDVGVVRIRLHGIDAPEAGQRCGEANGRGTWACGTAATNRMAELVDGQEIACEARDRDQYGRIIAVCFAEEQDVNAALVAEGLAWAYLRYSEDYADLEAEARATETGIWRGEAEAPWDYRANRWERAAEASPRPGCPIKGNINRDGEKIYHTPWSPWYERTQIDESRGQRWFCDEAEAEAAGWRPARWR